MDTVAGLINHNNMQQSTQEQHRAACSSSEDLNSIKRSLHDINHSFSQLKVAYSYFANSNSPHEITNPVSANMDVDMMADSSTSGSSAVTAPAIITTPTLVTPTTPLRMAPQYKMQRWVKSVPDLWPEYTIGFEVGNVKYDSTEELDRKYKGGWKSETGMLIMNIVRRRFINACFLLIFYRTQILLSTYSNHPSN
jgi:hypothetical protein